MPDSSDETSSAARDARSTTERWQGRLPDGVKGTCRYCGGPVTPPRRTWCSAACVQERAIRTSAASARAHVYDRDKGVCALCGLDTDALEREATALLTEKRKVTKGWTDYVTMVVPGRGEQSVNASRSFWQADHIVPVAEGGGACGLDNYRTLCVWCHPKETGKLRRRLNARKRDAVEARLPGTETEQPEDRPMVETLTG